ncbi:MAG: hypothetical protein AABX89_02770 [Candidatus Thermoplasmatota archaeon]
MLVETGPKVHAGAAWPDGSIHLVQGDSSLALNSTIRALAQRGPGIIVAASQTSAALRAALALDRIENVHIVDCVTALTAARPPSDSATTYLESPNLLEAMALRAQAQMARGGRWLVVDCLSSLADHNGLEAVAEWTHTMVNQLRSRDITGAMVFNSATGEGLESALAHHFDGVARLPDPGLAGPVRPAGPDPR